MSTEFNNEWINDNESDPRFPTDPEYIEVTALAEHYNVSVESILDMAREQPSACVQNTGSPWVDHPGEPKNVYFHEPTLQQALLAKKG